MRIKLIKLFICVVFVILGTHVSFADYTINVEPKYKKYCQVLDEYEYLYGDSCENKCYVAVVRISAPSDYNLMVSFSKIYNNLTPLKILHEHMVTIVDSNPGSPYELDCLLTCINQKTSKIVIIQSDKKFDAEELMAKLHFYPYEYDDLEESYPLVKEWNIKSDVILLPHIP